MSLGEFPGRWWRAARSAAVCLLPHAALPLSYHPRLLPGRIRSSSLYASPAPLLGGQGLSQGRGTVGLLPARCTATSAPPLWPHRHRNPLQGRVSHHLPLLCWRADHGRVGHCATSGFGGGGGGYPHEGFSRRGGAWRGGVCGWVGRGAASPRAPRTHTSCELSLAARISAAAGDNTNTACLVRTSAPAHAPAHAPATPKGRLPRHITQHLLNLIRGLSVDNMALTLAGCASGGVQGGASWCRQGREGTSRAHVKTLKALVFVKRADSFGGERKALQSPAAHSKNRSQRQ